MEWIDQIIKMNTRLAWTAAMGKMNETSLVKWIQMKEIQMFEFMNWAKGWLKKADARAQLKNSPTARGFYRIPSQAKASACFHFENIPPNRSN